MERDYRMNKVKYLIPNIDELERRVLIKSFNDLQFYRDFYNKFGRYNFTTKIRNLLYKILGESKDNKDIERLIFRRKQKKDFLKVLKVYRILRKSHIQDTSDGLLNDFANSLRVNHNLEIMKRYIYKLKEGEYDTADKLLTSGFRSYEEGLVDETEVSKNIDETLERIADAERREKIGNFGFKHLDRSTGGLWIGDFVLFFGRPGVGKSIFLLNIAHHNRISGKKVAIITLEMDNERVKRRYYSTVTRFDYKKRFKLGRLTPKLKRIIKRKVIRGGGLGGKLYLINVKGECTLGILNSIIQKYKIQKGVEIFGIDFIDCVKSGTRSWSEQHELGVVSKEIKELANRYEVSIIGITHMNMIREEAEEEGTIQQRDVGYSQRKVQFCDSAIGMLRSNRDKEEGLITLQAVKMRDSESELSFKLRPDLDHMRFDDI